MGSLEFEPPSIWKLRMTEEQKLGTSYAIWVMGYSNNFQDEKNRLSSKQKQRYCMISLGFLFAWAGVGAVLYICVMKNYPKISRIRVQCGLDFLVSCKIFYID